MLGYKRIVFDYIECVFILVNDVVCTGSSGQC